MLSFPPSGNSLGPFSFPHGQFSCFREQFGAVFVPAQSVFRPPGTVWGCFCARMLSFPPSGNSLGPFSFPHGQFSALREQFGGVFVPAWSVFRPSGTVWGCFRSRTVSFPPSGHDWGPFSCPHGWFLHPGTGGPGFGLEVTGSGGAAGVRSIGLSVLPEVEGETTG